MSPCIDPVGRTLKGRALIGRAFVVFDHESGLHTLGEPWQPYTRPWTYSWQAPRNSYPWGYSEFRWWHWRAVFAARKHS